MRSDLTFSWRSSGIPDIAQISKVGELLCTATTNHSFTGQGIERIRQDGVRQACADVTYTIIVKALTTSVFIKYAERHKSNVRSTYFYLHEINDQTDN